MTTAPDDDRPALPGNGEGSEPADPDGQFDSEDMPTTDGEMSDGAATPEPLDSAWSAD